MIRPLLLAFQFLTRLPISIPIDPTPEVVGRSLLFYPLVGGVVGAGLWGLATLLPQDIGLLAAALCLLFWVWITGALHLDGVADSADAWVGGMGDRQRTLDIMKDPASGPIGVTVLMLLLVLKLTALQQLLSAQMLLPLIAIPVVGRAVVVLLLITTPYVRAGGMGEGSALYAPRFTATVVVLLSIAVWIVLTTAAGIGALMLMAGVFLWWRYVMLQRLGGTTGDTAGAMIEFIEVSALIGLVLWG